MNTVNANKKELYGVNYVYPLELERLKPDQWIVVSNRKTHCDGEVYHTRIRSKSSMHTVYIGEGYNLGNRFIRHGKGKALWPGGTTKYVGDFMHDTASGNGIMYFENETLCYEGEVWLNRWHGKGKCYRESGALQYEGTFFEGLINGKGRFYFENGNLSYEGEAKDGAIHGYGRKYHENGAIYYEGRVDMGNPDGFGRIYYDDGTLRYEGEIENLSYSGQGRQYSENGILEYEGEFADGERCGHGLLYDPDTGKLIRDGVFSQADSGDAKIEDWEDFPVFEEYDDFPDGAQ